jgi:uncharacterized protein
MFLKKTKKLEVQIDEFLDKILNAALYFKQGVKYYLAGEPDLFNDALEKIDITENEADNLRRTIETKLYRHTLIPEQRGDVLGLLESSDKVINNCKEVLFKFSVEKPEFGSDYLQRLESLTVSSVTSVECMVSAVRSYFTEFTKVRDHINKVIFFEKESDTMAEKLNREIFGNPGLELSRKMHMGYFVTDIENIADFAEDVCDRLSIAVIKRYG